MRGSGSHWGWPTGRSNTAVTNANMVRLRGRHLLDHEALTCLLVLLFVDDPKLNTNRLHRVLRNLCYYTPTRIWVINTLLSVLQRLSDTSQEVTVSVETLAPPPEKKQPGLSASKEKLRKKGSHHDIAEHGGCSPPGADGQVVDDLPAWLNFYLCASLGSQTNVFRLQRNTERHHGRGASGGSTPTPTGISIHPQASALVCRHVLDMLISLAKTFASQFLPELKASNCSSGEKDERDVESSDDRPRGKDTPSKGAGQQLSPGKDLATSGMAADAAKSHTDFWDHLVKLDCMVGGKKGKSIPRPQAGVFVDCSLTPSCYETSPLGQLMTMLAHPVVRRSHLLTDRLLRLLGLVSGAMPELAAAAQAPVSAAAPGASAAAPGTTTSNSLAHFNIYTLVLFLYIYCKWMRFDMPCVS